MMILKYALVGLVLLGGVNTYAQENAVSTDAQTEEKKTKTPAERAEKQTAEMTELLSLTPEQVEKVSVLNLKVAQKIQAIKKNDSLEKEKKREYIKGNKGDHKNVMKSILTADQLAIYEDSLAKKKEEHQEKKRVKVHATE